MKHLNQIPFSKLEAALDEALTARRDEGFTLVKGRFGLIRNKECCAVVAYENKGCIGYEIPPRLWALIGGWDGRAWENMDYDCKITAAHKKYFDLGRKLADKYKPSF